MSTFAPSAIEILEDRVAPAAIASFTFRPNSVKYIDADGDQVTISFSKSFITPANVNSVFTLTPSGLLGGAVLDSIDLTQAATTPAKLANMSITATAKRPHGGTGDGLVNIGLINASGFNLGNVRVTGNLGNIEAGAGGTALRTVTLGSLGSPTQVAAGSLDSNINGSLTKLAVTGNVDGTFLHVNGNLGTVSIGGNLDGSTQMGESAGALFAGGSIKTVTIKGNVRGNDSPDSGEIKAVGGNITTVNIKGNLDGSLAGSFGSSGDIVAGGSLGSITIAGSVFGDGKTYSGELAAVSMGKISIGGDLGGAELPGTPTISPATIMAINSISGITIGHDITQGSTIRSGEQISSLAVKGSIVGTAASPVIISAKAAVQTRTNDVAFGSISVSHDMTYGLVLAGYTTTLSAQDPDAQIGPVSIGGNFTASDIVAGVRGTMNGNSFVFGTASDAGVDTGYIPSVTIVSKIASITIGGTAAGDSTVGASYGITAEYVASLKIGGKAQALQAGISNDLFSTGKELVLAPNLTVDEVPFAIPS